MEVETLRKFQNDGLVHVVFKGAGSEYRWENGTLTLVSEQSVILRTIEGMDICIRSQDLIRVETYRERPRDEDWRATYALNRVSVPYEEDRDASTR